MSERQRFAAIVTLLVLGLAMVALADLLDAYWPLFLTPLPYAVIPWLAVHDESRLVAPPGAAGDSARGAAQRE